METMMKSTLTPPIASDHPTTAVLTDEEAIQLQQQRDEFELIYGATNTTSHQHHHHHQSSSSTEQQETSGTPITLFDYVQWISSFSLEAIPVTQMDEWREVTVKRILQNCWNSGHLLNQVEKKVRVYEIGCGTGIILFELIQQLKKTPLKPMIGTAAVASSTDSSSSTTSHAFLSSTPSRFDYVGVELSPVCVEGLRERIRVYAPDLESSVKIHVAAAHQINYEQPEIYGFGRTSTSASDTTNSTSSLFDLIIMNSVTLYFPSTNYLERVLLAPMPHLSPSGSFFVGDIRDSRLIDLFYLAIAIERDPQIDLENTEVLAGLDQAKANDPHLLVDPFYFIKFAHQHRDQISSLLIQPKLFKHSFKNYSSTNHRTAEVENEMNRFRFDVTMYPASTEPSTQRLIVPIVVDQSGAITQPQIHRSKWMSMCQPEKKLAHSTISSLDRTASSSDSGSAVHWMDLRDLFEDLCGQLVKSKLTTDNTFSGFKLFSYPHLPVLIDSLATFSVMNRHSKMQPSKNFEFDVDTIAHTLLTPSELLNYFESFVRESAPSILTPSNPGYKFRLELTLDPFDATELIGMIFLSLQQTSLSVQYQVLETDKTFNGTDFTRSVASAPTKQSHHHSHLGVVDRLMKRLWDQEINSSLRLYQPTTDAIDVNTSTKPSAKFASSTSTSPARPPTSAATEVPTIPSLIWQSIHYALTNGFSKQVALKQILQVGNSSMPTTDNTNRTSREDSLNWEELAGDILHFSTILSQQFHPEAGSTIIQFVDRSIYQIVSMLSIFHLGCIYTPLSVSPQPDPIERIAKILVDCRPTVIITTAQFKAHLLEAIQLYMTMNRVGEADDLPESSPIQLVCIDDYRADFIRARMNPSATLSTDVLPFLQTNSTSDPLNTAYCIYTSGSTGQPKACCLTHHNFSYLFRAFYQIKLGPWLTNDFEQFNSSSALGDSKSLSMRILQTTPSSFDLHIYECLAPIVAASLNSCRWFGTITSIVAPGELALLRPGGHLDVDYYVDAIACSSISHVVCTPSFMRLILEHCTINSSFYKLRSVIIWRMGGEAVHQAMIDEVLPKLRQVQPKVQFICSYGPAECTDTATTFQCQISTDVPKRLKADFRGDPGTGQSTHAFLEATKIVPIGLPLPHYGAYVFVESNSNSIEMTTNGPSSVANSITHPLPHVLRLARPGEIGVLYLCGSGVFNGYLNRVDLTNKSIVVRPDLVGHHLRLYRTGDLVQLRYLSSSSPSIHSSLPISSAEAFVAPSPSIGSYQLLYIGRADFAQIKLRGQRLEAGEIEAVLMKHVDISQVIIIKQSPSTDHPEDEYLAAYFTRKLVVESEARSHSILCTELHQLCRTTLPAYMIPTSFTVLKQFPLNKNGKLDRQQLPIPNAETDFIAGRAEIAPISSGSASSSPPNFTQPSLVDDRHFYWLLIQLSNIWRTIVDVDTTVSDSVLCELDQGVASKQDRPSANKDAPSMADTSKVMSMDQFIHRSWLEFGANSLSLMRFLARLKRFISSLTLVVPSPPSTSNTSTPPTPTIDSYLTFASVYKLRNLYSLTEALKPFIHNETHFKVKTTVQPIINEEELTPSSEAVTRVDSDSSTASVHPIPAADAPDSNPSAVKLSGEEQFLIPPPTGPLPVLTYPVCSQQFIVMQDELARFQFDPNLDRKKPLYNCPYLLNLKPSTSTSTIAPPFTLSTAMVIEAQFSSILHRIILSHPALTVSFSFLANATKAYQHPFQLSDERHREDTKMTRHFIWGEETNGRGGGWRGDTNVIYQRNELRGQQRNHRNYAPNSNSTSKPTQDPLSKAIWTAANERIMTLVKQPHQAYFKFHVFYELQPPTTESTTTDPLADSLDPSTPVLSMHALLVFHHINFDGESMKLIMNQIKLACQQDFQSAQTALTPLFQPTRNYFNYCHWFESAGLYQLGPSLEYWLQHLSNWSHAQLTCYQPYKHADGLPLAETFNATAKKVRSYLSPTEVRHLRQFCVEHHITPYIYLMTCYFLTLYTVRLRNSRRFPGHAEMDGNVSQSSSPTNSTGSLVDITIGSAMGNRSPSNTGGFDLTNECGLLANSLPFRVKFAPSMSLKELLDHVCSVVLNHLTHSAIPYGWILYLMAVQQGPTAIAINRRPCANPCYSSAFLYEDSDYSQTLKGLPFQRTTPVRPEQASQHEGLNTSSHSDSTSPGSFPVDIELLELPDFGCIFELALKVNECEANYEVDQEMQTQATASSSNEKYASSIPSPSPAKTESTSTSPPTSSADQHFVLTWEYSDQLYDDGDIQVVDDNFHQFIRILQVQSTNQTTQRTVEDLSSPLNQSVQACVQQVMSQP